MDKEIMEQFQMLAGMMEKMSGQLNSRMDNMESRMDRMESRMDSMESRMDRMESRMVTKDDLREAIRASEARTNVYIENTITKRLDALVDGYKSVHEKQWELERDNEQLKAQVSDLQDRVARIERQITA